MVLREMNASVSILSAITGLSRNRIGLRLHEMELHGIVVPLEVRSDSTVIWALTAAIRPTGLVAVPLPGQRLKREAGDSKSPLDAGLELLNAALKRKEKQGAAGGAQDSESIAEGFSINDLRGYEDE